MRPWPRRGAAQRRLRRSPRPGGGLPAAGRVPVRGVRLPRRCGRKLTAALDALPVAEVTATSAAGTGPHPSGGAPAAGPVRPAARARRPRSAPPGPAGGPAGGRDRRHLPRRPRQPAATRARLSKGRQPVRRPPATRRSCLLALVACGTRTLIDAAFGPRTGGETTYGQRLARSPAPRHDRPAGPQLRRPTRSWPTSPAPAPRSWPGCHGHPQAPVLGRFPDGSFLSRLGRPARSASSSARSPSPPPPGDTPASTGWPPPCSTTTATRQSELVTPVSRALGGRVRLLRDLKKTMLGRRVLRAPHPAPASTRRSTPCSCAYQVLRTAIADATEHPARHRPRPGQFQRRPRRPPATRSSRPRASSPTPSSTSSARSAEHVLDQPHARPPPPRQPPRRQTPAVPIRVQEPASRPAHLQSHHRHLDANDRP